MEQDPEKELLKQQTVELQKQVELLTQKLEQLENAQNPEKKA
jgi:phage-related minor tail protein